MAQMTKQKKAQLIDYFGLVWTKNAQVWKIWENGSHFFQNSPQNRIWETSIGHKNFEKGPTFSSKIPERG